VGEETPSGAHNPKKQAEAERFMWWIRQRRGMVRIISRMTMPIRLFLQVQAEGLDNMTTTMQLKERIGPEYLK